MKLTNEEREKYRKEYLKAYDYGVVGSYSDTGADYWLSVIDTILEERVEEIKREIETIPEWITYSELTPDELALSDKVINDILKLESLNK
jgi:hypothetical protein